MALKHSFLSSNRLKSAQHHIEMIKWRNVIGGPPTCLLDRECLMRIGNSKVEVYDSDQASLLARAFDEAWEAAQQVRPGLSIPADQMREALALRIIELSKTGEWNVSRLRDDALEHLQNESARHNNSNGRE